MFRVLRAVFVIAFAIIGGILGFQVWQGLAHQSVISELMHDRPQLLPWYGAAFATIGVLAALLSSSLALNQVVKSAEDLKQMPANDKIALLFGALLGITFTLMLSP